MLSALSRYMAGARVMLGCPSACGPGSVISWGPLPGAAGLGLCPCFIDEDAEAVGRQGLVTAGTEDRAGTDTRSVWPLSLFLSPVLVASNLNHAERVWGPCSLQSIVSRGGGNRSRRVGEAIAGAWHCLWSLTGAFGPGLLAEQGPWFLRGAVALGSPSRPAMAVSPSAPAHQPRGRLPHPEDASDGPHGPPHHPRAAGRRVLHFRLHPRPAPGHLPHRPAQVLHRAQQPGPQPPEAPLRPQ